MKKIYCALAILFAAGATQAQNNVGINNANPNASAALMVDTAATGPQGVLVPRMTQARRDAIASPANGLMIYQTNNTPGFYYYNGTAWITLTGATGQQGAQGLQGNTGATGAQGPQGNVGATGAQGPQGNTGATGAQGPQGNTGATGAQGPQGNAGAQGATGTQGATGAQGAQGPAGPGVPTGGSAGQVLTKIDGTNYNTQWSTATGGATLQVMATKTGTGQSINPGSAGNPTITDLQFDNVITSPTAGTFTNSTTFTVSATGAGLYLITVSAGTLLANGNGIPPYMQLLVNGSPVCNGTGASQQNLSTSPGRAGLSMALTLAAGAVVKVQVQNPLTAAASIMTTTTDGTTRLSITKLN